jgi:hypothetical protein
MSLMTYYSELKRREKAREREAKKAATSKPAAAAKGPNEDELTPNVTDFVFFFDLYLLAFSNISSFALVMF